MEVVAAVTIPFCNRKISTTAVDTMSLACCCLCPSPVVDIEVASFLLFSQRVVGDEKGSIVYVGVYGSKHTQSDIQKDKK